MRLFQAALATCLDSPFFASLSVHGLHFTVYAPSIKFAKLREGSPKFPRRRAPTLVHPGTCLNSAVPQCVNICISREIAHNSMTQAILVRVRAGREKPYTTLLHWKTLFCWKEGGGHKGKISVIDMVSLVLKGRWIYHRPGFFEAKFSNLSSFWDGSVRVVCVFFFLVCLGVFWHRLFVCVVRVIISS